MKKKLAVVLAVVMTASLLTACGGKKDATEPTSKPENETQAPAEDTTDTPSDADTTEGDMVSDENFAILQENYALITEYAAQVREVYTSDEIAANSVIEDAILQTEDIIAQMGELEQTDITEDDAIALNHAMELMIETYNTILDGMEVVENEETLEEGEMVSDETFAELKETYDTLTDIYNTVAETYNNSEMEDADIKAAMDEAYNILEQMGEITQDTLTEEDAEELAGAMVAAAEMLETIAGSMNQ